MGAWAHQDGCEGDGGRFWGGGGLGGGLGCARVVGDFGGRNSRSKSFSDVNDIDITLLNIDWAGSLGEPNHKKINHPEVTC